MRELPQDACKHQNETVIVGANDPYKNTQIQCEDCGSVRFKATFDGEDDLSHEETQ